MRSHRFTRGAHAYPAATRVKWGIAATASLALVVPLVVIASETAGATTGFTAGNVVVYRVGDGSSSLSSSSTKVFLDEYTPSGSLVQSIAMPTTTSGSNKPLVASGSANSEGLLTLSPNGQYLAAPGYDAAVGVSNIADTSAASTPRTVATINAAGVVNTSTALTDFSDANNPRSAATTDGTHLYVGGAAGGARAATVGASTSTALTSTTFKNVRQVSVVGGQLYTSADPSKASVTVATVGTGTPTSGGQSVTNLSFSAAPAQPYAYSLLTLGAGSTPDTLYVADNSASAVIKYIKSGSSWTKKGSVTVSGVTGVTANDAGGTVTLFATSSGSSGTSGTLYSIVDSSGATGTLSGSATLIHTAPSKEAYRGVAFTPGTVIGSGGTGTPPSGPPTISADHNGLPAAMGDSTNPGLTLTVGDDDHTADQLTVTATSSNTTVAPSNGISITGTGATRTLTVTPGAVGYSTIVLKVTAPDGTNSSTSVTYAVSANQGSSTDRYLSGSGNFSTAIEVGDGYMLAADDENDIIRLYQEGQSGAAVKSFDFTSQLPFGSQEVDIEAAAQVGNTIYWTGSMSTTNDGDLAPERSTLFATTVTGSGASTSLSYVGSYTGLLADTVSWDQHNGHGLGANFFGLANSASAGTGGHDNDAFDVEGMEFAQGSATTAYLAFRAPNEPTNNRHLALVVPVTNLPALISGGGSVHATYGAPIQMNLGGRGIREMRKNADGQYLIIAGTPNGDNDSFGLYQWDGNPAHPPLASGTSLPIIPSGSGNQGSWEAIVNVPDPLVDGAGVQLVQDDGDTAWYGDGETSKDNLAADLQKDLERTFTYVAPVLPATHTSITSSTATSAIGDAVTYTATVSPQSGSGTPTGTATFADSGVAISGCAALPLDGTGKAVCTVTYPSAASHSVTAVYSGDNSFAASTSTAVQESVQPWALTITASDESRGYGSADPTFAFVVGGLMGTDSLITPPTCTVAGSHTAVGTYPIVCVGADAGPNYSINYLPATLTVTKAQADVTPSAEVNPVVTGQPVVITAAVAAPGVVATPNGTVQFSTGGTAVAGCETIALVSGSASCALADGLAAGSYPIAVTYSGDSSFDAGESPVDALIVQVNPATTTTSLVADDQTVVSGQAVTFTASVAVSAPGSTTAITPSGTINFQADGVNLPGCVAVPVSGADASCAVPDGFLPPSQTITATYSGDANFSGSPAAPITETVTKASTTTSVAAAPNPVTSGSSVSYAATVAVTAPGSGAPTGTVAFADDAGPIDNCSAVAISQFAPYTATCVTSAGSPGTDSVVASYSGDAAFAESTDQRTVVINRPAVASITLSPSSGEIAGGQQQSYEVSGKDGEGNDLGSVLSETTLTITPDGTCSAGFCTAAIPGTHTVTATDGTATATATLTVDAGPVGLPTSDVVGVGDDLSQYGFNFFTDGDAAGHNGVNAGPNISRVSSLDATGDFNGRGSYSTGGASANPDGLDSTVVLANGSEPVARPIGSTAAIATLLGDTGTVQHVQFARTTRLPTAAEQAAAGAQGWGGLHVIRYADDKLVIAVSKAGTNAPTGLSAAELVKIYDGTYRTWNDIPGYAGPAGSNQIVALLPRAGSDTRTMFDADLAAANGGTPVHYAASIASVDENDYAVIAGSTSPSDAIVPFSSAKLSLIASQYFGSAADTVTPLAAVAPDGAASYAVSHPLYVVVRDSDIASTNSWRSSANNWAHTLLVGQLSFLARSSTGSVLMTAAGFTPDYADLGDRTN